LEPFKIKITIDIPDRLLWPLVLILLLYRRIRYGYAFRKILLTRGKFAIVDPEDYEHLSQYKWCAVKSKKTYYASRTFKDKASGKRRKMSMHQIIFKVSKGMVCDHINRNGLDNRKANLRSATYAQNRWNQKASWGKSKYRGVSWDSHSKKWRVIIKCHGVKKELGMFTNELEAAKVYDEAAKKYYGEFACLNLPEERSCSKKILFQKFKRLFSPKSST
jgi:hypothetical protein